MNKILSCCLMLSLVLSGCSNAPSSSSDNSSSQVPAVDIIESRVKVTPESENSSASQTVIDNKDKSTKVLSIAVPELDLSVERGDYYGVPLVINDENYSIPTLKISNFYFISAKAISEMYDITCTITESEIEIEKGTKIKTKNLSKGVISKESIDASKLSILNDENNLAISFRNEIYIALPTINSYVDEKLYLDRDKMQITNKVLKYSELPETNNYLLRKRVTIDDSHELLVKTSSIGKTVSINDVYGGSLTIFPGGESSLIGYQDIFLHKLSDKTLIFAIDSTSISVSELILDENLKITIKNIGFIQKPVTSVYFFKNQYLAVSKTDIFSFAVKEDAIYEVNMSGIPNANEIVDSLVTVNKIPYAVIKTDSGIEVYRFDPTDYKLTLIKNISENMTFKTTPKNFIYAHTKGNALSIYAMDDTGYIYNILYDVNSEEITKTKSEHLNLIYTEKPYLVDFKIMLAETTDISKDSELYLEINGVNLGNKILAYMIEDDWVYCTELVGDEIYSLRYNAITGARDYS